MARYRNSVSSYCALVKSVTVFRLAQLVLRHKRVLIPLTAAWSLIAARKAEVVFVVGRLLKVPRGFKEREESIVDTKVEKDWALTRLIV